MLVGVGRRIRAPEGSYLSGCCLEAQGRDGRKGRCSGRTSGRATNHTVGFAVTEVAGDKGAGSL